MSKDKFVWDKGALKKVLKENFEDHLFVVVSNREPYLHTYDKEGKIKCESSVGGVSIVFDSILKNTKGTWIAYGGSKADKETADKNGYLNVPPKNPQYTLKRIWMTEEERKGYYDGLSNETLWPLCHSVFVRPAFREKDWQAYKTINKRFAEAVLEEIKGKKALVWIQDYQLALVAKYIKKERPDVSVAQFWHIPWPTQEVFRTCPWAKDILTGLLANDLLGFHCYHHVDNFLKSVAKELEAKVDFEDLSVTFQGKKTKTGAFPISIDYEEIVSLIKNYKKEEEAVSKYVESKYKYLAVGVDRIDYTKGIPNRLLAIEKFLENNKSYLGKFVYLGIGAPSRTTLDAYEDLNGSIAELVERINKRFATKSWKPIHFINRILRRDEILKISHHADLCIVTPLDDGMNLVAKEFVAANNGDGALVLSSSIGAAKELTDAFLVNPYDTKSVANAIKKALECPIEEKRERMMNMKKVVAERNVFRWSAKFLLEMAEIKQKIEKKFK